MNEGPAGGRSGEMMLFYLVGSLGSTAIRPSRVTLPTGFEEGYKPLQGTTLFDIEREYSGFFEIYICSEG